MVEHSSAIPKVPNSISHLFSYWVHGILHFTPGVVHNFPKAVGISRISIAHAQKDPKFLFKKRREQPQEFWSLVSRIDGSTLPKDCAEEQLC